MTWRRAFEIVFGTLDGWCDRFNARGVRVVQMCVADPLQFSGVDLDTQIRVCSIVVTAGWIMCCVEAVIERNWITLVCAGVMVPVSIGQVMLPDYLLRIAPLKQEGVIWACCSVLVIRYGYTIVSLAYLLRFFLIHCEPKPPVRDMHLQEQT